MGRETLVISIRLLLPSMIICSLEFICYSSAITMYLMPLMSSSIYLIDDYNKFTLIRMKLCKTTPKITIKMYIIAKTHIRSSLILKGLQRSDLNLISCVFNVNLQHTHVDAKIYNSIQ